MNNTALDYLTHRFVLFSVEGTAEGAVIQTLYDNNLLVVPRDHVVMDNTYFKSYVSKSVSILMP